MATVIKEVIDIARSWIEPWEPIDKRFGWRDGLFLEKSPTGKMRPLSGDHECVGYAVKIKCGMVRVGRVVHKDYDINFGRARIVNEDTFNTYSDTTQTVITKVKQ